MARPDGWTTHALGDLADVWSGNTPPRSRPDFWGGDTPWVGPADLYDRRVHSAPEQLTPDGAALAATPAVPGDVLVVVRSMALSKRLFFAQVRRNPIAFNQDIKGLRANERVATEYLPYLLWGNHDVLHSLVDEASHGTKRLRSEVLFHQQLALPPLREQRAIASVLGTLDDKIESNRRYVATQVATRASAFHDNCREATERKPLSAIASPVKAPVQPSETPAEVFEQFSIPAFDDGDPDICLGSTMASGKTQLPDEPVVLFSKLNPRTPRIWNPVASGVGTPVCSPEFLVLQPAGEATHAWLDACLRHDERFYAEVLAGVTGTTGSRQRVKPADVMRSTVPGPRAGQIQEWTAFAAPMIEQESSLIRESRTLTAIRDALLPKLVSGKIRVPLSDDPEEQVGAALEALSA